MACKVLSRGAGFSFLGGLGWFKRDLRGVGFSASRV